jgi:hypothetical protein
MVSPWDRRRVTWAWHGVPRTSWDEMGTAMTASWSHVPHLYVVARFRFRHQGRPQGLEGRSKGLVIGDRRSGVRLQLKFL